MTALQSELFADGSSPAAQPIPSLIKWTGSKRLLAPSIIAHFPKYRRYCEPFVGGGSLLFAASSPGSIAGDVYKPLIELWQLLKVSPALVCDDYERQWRVLSAELDALNLAELPPDELLPRYFYEVRERFNRQHSPLDLNFIMRTCVNGIVRFNDAGAFNNSFHLSRRGMTPARFRRAVTAWRTALQNTSFVCQDYRDTLEMVECDDFVYFDPPYAASRNRYIADTDLRTFFQTLEDLNSRGIKWALSFDGRRGATDLTHDVPSELFVRHRRLQAGPSAVKRVLSGPLELVEESLYLNF